MNQETEIPIPSAPTADSPAPSQPETKKHVDCTAVSRCRKVYEDTYRAALAKVSEWQAEKAARAAYRDALPPLLGSSNIRRYIACVAQGMILDVFDHNDTQRLLYAAQVANSALGKARKKRKTSPESAA